MIVKENIEFKRGTTSKDALNIGDKAQISKIIFEELIDKSYLESYDVRSKSKLKDLKEIIDNPETSLKINPSPPGWTIELSIPEEWHGKSFILSELIRITPKASSHLMKNDHTLFIYKI